MIDPPFSPQTLAERWGCSPQYIRKMADDGKLPYFRIGAKMIRIPAAAVVRYECDNLQTQEPETRGGSGSTAASSSSSGIVPPENPPLESQLVRTTVGLPKLSLVASGTPTTTQ